MWVDSDVRARDRGACIITHVALSHVTSSRDQLTGSPGNCSELLGAARSCSELLGAARSYCSEPLEAHRAARSCAELLGAVRHCPWLLGAARSCSELLLRAPRPRSNYSRHVWAAGQSTERICAAEWLRGLILPTGGPAGEGWGGGRGQ